MSAMAQHEENMAIDAAIDAGVDAMLQQTETMDQNAGEIGQELKEQIGMSKDINNHMDTTDANINKATDKLKDVQKVSGGGCLSWILCILFFLLTILVCVLPPSILNNFRSKKRADKGW